MIHEGERSVGSQVGSGLVLAGRLVAWVAVWCFGTFAVMFWVLSAGPTRWLTILWMIITVGSLLFALTGWPFRRQRFGLPLWGRLVAGLCVPLLGLWSLLASSAFDPKTRLVAIPAGTLAVAALLIAIAGQSFMRWEGRDRSGQ